MNPLIQDIIDATVDGEPTRVQTAFDQMIGQKIMDALEARKREVAANMFSVQQDEEDIDQEAQHAEDEDSEPAEKTD